MALTLLDRTSYLLDRTSYLLDAIAAALWPNGDPDAEWDTDTTQAIGDLMTRAGYRPEPEGTLHCDLCDKVESADDLTPDWNGETGNHASCEAVA